MPTVPDSTPTQPLDPLYSRNPGSVDAAPAPTVTTLPPALMRSKDATAGNAGGADGTAEQANLGGYNAAKVFNTDDSKSAYQLNEITSQKSPLMQRAAATGLLTAGRRGLQNSSIAAGAAMGEMADRATPLALQDATTAANRNLSNQAATNRASEFTAQQENVGELENSRAQNEIDTTNAQLQTAVSQGNAQQANQLRAKLADLRLAASTANAQLQSTTDLANAEAANKMRADTLAQNAELNKQFLAGTQAMDLASIQGRYSQLISSNTSASQLFESYTTGVSSIMANSELSPARVAQSVQLQQTMLEAGLRMIDSMNSLDLGEFTLPGTTAVGTGDSARIISTPGTGATETDGTAPVVNPRRGITDPDTGRTGMTGGIR